MAAGGVAPVGVGAPLTTIMLGARGLDGPVGGGQETDVASGIQLLAAPLVPRFCSFHTSIACTRPAIARRCKFADKAGVGARIGRSGFNGEDRVARAGQFGALTMLARISRPSPSRSPMT